MTLKEILHLLADGISLIGPVREDLHTAIHALGEDGSAPPPAPEPELTAEEKEIAELQARIAQLQTGQPAQAAQ